MFAQVSQRKIFLIAAVCLIVALAAFFGTRAAISGGGGPAAPSVITTPPGSDARSSHEALKTRIAEIRQALREHPERFPDPAQMEKYLADAEEFIRRGQIDQALLEAEKAKPKFEGVINGIFITPNTDAFRQAVRGLGASACVNPDTGAGDPKRIELISSDGQDAAQAAAFNNRVRGNPLDVAPEYLPPGFVEFLQTASFCDGVIQTVGREFGLRASEVAIQKFKDWNAFTVVASQDRIEAATVAGRPAVFVKGVGQNFTGQQLILIKTDYGLIVLDSSILSFAELIKIAEGIN